MSSCMLIWAPTLSRFLHYISGRTRHASSIRGRDEDKRRPGTRPDLRSMAERDEVIGFSLRAGKYEQRHVLTMHAVHHVRHQSVSIQTSTRTNKLHIIVC